MAPTLLFLMARNGWIVSAANQVSLFQVIGRVSDAICTICPSTGEFSAHRLSAGIMFKAGLSRVPLMPAQRT